MRISDRNVKKKNPFIQWFKDVWNLIKEHKKLVFIILGFIVVVVAAFVISTVVAKKKTEAVEQEAEQVETEEYLITDEALEVDAYPEINALMKQYYQAAAEGDVDTITDIKTAVDDKEKILIVKKSEFIESYPTIMCYTKKGPEEDTYIVFAYYEVKLVDFETPAPGLNAWYVCKKDDGTYYINDDEQDDKLADYCKLVSVQDDVVDLNNTVNVKFNEIMAQDEEMAKFLDELPEVLTEAVGEELAKAEAPQVEDIEEPKEEPKEQQEAETPVVKQAKTTDVVNIRSSDSETADKVGKAQKGDEFTVLEEKLNGWSKVEYEGKECFIKTEYLEIISDSTDTQEATANDEPGDVQAAANSPSSGKATANDTVNVRKEPSTAAEKVTVCYQGEQVEVLSKQSDGWSKIKYNGKTGYVKSEYLE